MPGIKSHFRTWVIKARRSKGSAPSKQVLGQPGLCETSSQKQNSHLFDWLKLAVMVILAHGGGAVRKGPNQVVLEERELAIELICL